MDMEQGRPEEGTSFLHHKAGCWVVTSFEKKILIYFLIGGYGGDFLQDKKRKSEEETGPPILLPTQKSTQTELGFEHGTNY